jgi:hypothetical protein
MSDTATLLTASPSGAPLWKPLTKGEVQACICDREGCCTVMTVLNIEENIIEIYQGNINSLHSCIARIVLPDNVALCRAIR